MIRGLDAAQTQATGWMRRSFFPLGLQWGGPVRPLAAAWCGGMQRACCVTAVRRAANACAAWLLQVRCRVLCEPYWQARLAWWWCVDAGGLLVRVCNGLTVICGRLACCSWGWCHATVLVSADRATQVTGPSNVGAECWNQHLPAWH